MQEKVKHKDLKFLANSISFIADIYQLFSMTPYNAKCRQNFLLREESNHSGRLHCHFCGKGPLRVGVGMLSKMVATVDHIVPLALGGINTQDNFQVCCSKCNRRKGSRFIG